MEKNIPICTDVQVREQFKFVEVNILRKYLVFMGSDTV